MIESQTSDSIHRRDCGSCRTSASCCLQAPALCGEDKDSSRPYSELADRPLHLQLHQPVELYRVFHRQLFHQWLDETRHDQASSLILGDAAAHQVEELFFAN